MLHSGCERNRSRSQGNRSAKDVSPVKWKFSLHHHFGVRVWNLRGLECVDAAPRDQPVQAVRRHGQSHSRRHSFTAGFEADFAHSDSANSSGQQTTRPFVTLGVGPNNVGVPTITAPGFSPNDVATAQSLLAVLAGSVLSVQQQYSVDSPTATDWLDYRKQFLFHRDFHENDWALFFKDNWKVSRNFTLTLGLRYDKY